MIILVPGETITLTTSTGTVLVDATYADRSGATFLEGNQRTSVTGTSTVVDAPNSGARMVKNLYIKPSVTATITVTVDGAALIAKSVDAGATVDLFLDSSFLLFSISQVSGLQAALDLKAPLASPALTGIPTAPTAAADTNTTQIATTAFAKAEADAAQAASQPLDSDLTAIAALTTTAYGRGALTLADAPAFASYAGVPLLATTGITGTLTLTKTGTTARTYTFPDAAITVAGSAAALTSGRVPYVTTGGLLTDSAALLFATSIAPVGGVSAGFTATIGNGGATNAFHVIDAAAGRARYYVVESAGSPRFAWGVTSTAEGSADAGSNWFLAAYTDAGAGIDNPISIVRASGGAITLARPVTATGVVTVPNGTAAAPGLRLTSEASGLYRISATSIGVSVAGALVLTVGSTASSLASGSTFAIANTTASTNTTSGALTVAGGGAFAKELVTGLGLWLVDGQTAPSATSGYAKVYVDTSDGDLKVIFGDGTIKTIVTDT